MYIQLPILTLTGHSDQHVLQEMASVCLHHNIFVYSIVFAHKPQQTCKQNTFLSLLTKPTIVASDTIVSLST